MQEGCAMSQSKGLHANQEGDVYPPHLMEPSLQNRLRVIGRYLDRQHLHSISLMEVAGGFIARACRVGEAAPIVVEVLDEDFPRMIGEAIAARGEGEHERTVSKLLPTGYEDFLRALGYELDQRVAENIVVTEFVSFVTVTGVEPSMNAGVAAYDRFSYALSGEEISKLLDAAFARRGTYSPLTTYIPAGTREL
jgi:hypothetical protein